MKSFKREKRVFRVRGEYSHITLNKSIYFYYSLFKQKRIEKQKFKFNAKRFKRSS